MQSPSEVKLERLHETLKSLQAQRTKLSKEAHLSAASIDKSQPPDHTEAQALALAKETNQNHINLLNEYNEIKDVATSLIGMIAENQQRRIVDVMEDFDVREDD